MKMNIINIKSSYAFALFAMVILSSCVTGGFDENPQLDGLNDQLAKAPKIESIFVNGVEVKRNTQSIRIVEAAIGDVLSIEAKLASGSSAQLTDLVATRQYYGVEDPHGIDPAVPDGAYTLSGSNFTFKYDYTVPVQDDDAADFHPGDIILVNLLVSNSLENHGFKSFEIHIVE